MKTLSDSIDWLELNCELRKSEVVALARKHHELGNLTDSALAEVKQASRDRDFSAYDVLDVLSGYRFADIRKQLSSAKTQGNGGGK